MTAFFSSTSRVISLPRRGCRPPYGAGVAGATKRHDGRLPARADSPARSPRLTPAVAYRLGLIRRRAPPRLTPAVAYRLGLIRRRAPPRLTPAVAYRRRPRPDIRRRTARNLRRGRRAHTAGPRCPGRTPARADPPCGS